MIKRRTLVGAGGIWVVARAGHSQPARKIYRVGMLSVGVNTSEMAGPQPSAPTIAALLRGLRGLGYVYGETFVSEPRSAEGQVDRFPALVAELIRLPVDVIVAAGPRWPRASMPPRRCPS